MVLAPCNYTLLRQDDLRNPISFRRLFAFPPWPMQYQEAAGKGDPQTPDEFRARPV